jgi:hypothetical protein
MRTRCRVDAVTRWTRDSEQYESTRTRYDDAMIICLPKEAYR